MKKGISRRSFLRNTALAGAVSAIGTSGLLTSCKGNSEFKNTPLKQPGSYYIPNFNDVAIDGKELKAGIIGCGGRGSGAAFNFLEAANGVTITAIGDVFEDKVSALAKRLKTDKNIEIPENKRFVGVDTYKQVIDSGVDVVIIATPPAFRPEQFQYATEKNVHSFLEKPLFVDAVGYRKIVVTGKQAVAKNLCVFTGTQYHNQRSYIESFKMIMDGAIGEITGGNIWYNTGMLWYKERQPLWSDGETMLRDWVNWAWLSGDHIVEQHIHSMDIFMWFTGLKPKSAVGFGSRQRRITGDQYDNFSVDFEMENGIHLHSMCRQIDGCANNVSEIIQGTKGSWSTTEGTVIKDLSGNVIWKYDFDAEKVQFKQTNPFVLEHVDWINHIRGNKPVEQATETALTNLAMIMGREAAYTGSKITWDQLAASDLNSMPSDFSLTEKMNMSQFKVPVPGK